ncbi:MAG: DHA2 family efflux MFS transporter permease subunit [Betaproteobacteria bacterium]|nr:DHA2 family efflux MFS transporter permease subunit [Betaproteobacteria bacterium]
MNRLQRLTLVITGLGLFMIFLDALIVNVALPAIQAGFGVGEEGLQWVVTAYSLGMAVIIMTAATLADLHGRRRWFLIGISVFTGASVVCGVAPSLEVLNIARGVQGLAAATVNVTSLALLSAAFPDAKQKAQAIGIWTAIANVGAATGPSLGGLMVEHLGWRSIFLVNLPVGILVVLLSLRFIAESRDERPRQLDLPGQALFIVTVGALAYALIEGPRSGWASPLILALFAIAVVGGFLFVRTERRSADPMMDLSLFRNREYALAIGTMFVAFFAIYGMLLVMTQYLQNVQGLTPVRTGLMILPLTLVIMFLSPRVGQLVGRFGPRPLILIGLCGLIVGLLTFVASGHGSGPLVLLGFALCGFGAALCVTPITTLAMTSVPQQRAGMASGIMSAQRAIGSSVGFAVLGSVLAAWLATTLDADLTQVVPNPAERQEVAAAIVSSANPRAHVSEMVPRGPPVHPDPALRAKITAAADGDFVQGIRAGLLLAVALLLVALLVGWRGFPRAGAGLRDAEREEAKLAASEP